LLFAITGDCTEESRTWTSIRGASFAAKLVEVKGELVTLDTPAGRRVIPASELSAADRDYLEKLNLIKVAHPRKWTFVTGQSTDATFVKLAGSKVTLATADGRRTLVDLAQLSLEDRQYVFYQAPVPPGEWLCGEWRGWANDGDAIVQFRFTIKPTPPMTPCRTKLAIRVGLTQEQFQMAQAKKLNPAQVPNHPISLGVLEEMTVTLEGDKVTFKGSAIEEVQKSAKRPKWKLDTMQATLFAGGFMCGTRPSHMTNGKLITPAEGHFYCVRADLPVTPLPLALEKGKVTPLDCGGSHYKLYIPMSYDPSKPMPVLVNDSPSGNAAPLNTQMAEELGWIMAGLTESQNKSDMFLCNDNSNAALFEMERQLNLDQHRFYFSGFSGGARRASHRAWGLPDQTAGMIAIGAVTGSELGESVFPSPRVPVFFITGKTDMNNKEVTGDFDRAKKAGRPCEMIVHPGGHAWGRAEDHMAALRWLNKQWQEKPAQTHPDPFGPIRR